LGGRRGDRDRGVGLAAWVSAIRQRRPDGTDSSQGVSLAGHAGVAARLCGLGGLDARPSARGDRRGWQDAARFEDVAGREGRAASGSAYATEAGLVLAQRAVDGKSNEITAIPELLDMLNLKGAIVTIDAMGTQKEIARRVVDKGADYVLALKGNQTSLHED